MSQIEHYCFEEHEEIRRAAVECLCNMVVDEEVRSCIQQTVKLLHDILLLGRHLVMDIRFKATKRRRRKFEPRVRVWKLKGPTGQLCALWCTLP